MAAMRAWHHGRGSRHRGRDSVYLGQARIILGWERFMAVTCKNDINLRQGCNLMCSILGTVRLRASSWARVCERDDQVCPLRPQILGCAFRRIDHIFDCDQSEQLVTIPVQDLWRQHAEHADLDDMIRAAVIAQLTLEECTLCKEWIARVVKNIRLNDGAGHPIVKPRGGVQPEVEVVIAQGNRIIAQGRDGFAGGMLLRRAFLEKRGHRRALQQIAGIK
ncbi:MAG: hypothetical protein AAGK92_12425 [Pseudomonadota bacterium]